MTLSEILERKSTGIITIKASISALEAIDTMCRHKVGALLVESDDGELMGIATERDILQLCGARNGRLDGVGISEALTSDLIVGTTDCSIDEAMSLMTEHRFRHLPIVEGGAHRGYHLHRRPGQGEAEGCDRGGEIPAGLHQHLTDPRPFNRPRYKVTAGETAGTPPLHPWYDSMTETDQAGTQ
ncbi:MAG: CBS domain-containing protein [Sedimenticola sp.]